MIKDNQNFDIRRTSIKQVKSDQFDKVSIQKSSSIKISSSGGAGSEIKLRKKNTVSKIKTKSIVHFGEQNPELKNLKLPDNTIRSTKYNIFTFLPKSLLFQFQRVANVYFLVISILTCMPFSPKQPSSMIGTFCFVLLCTMVKEAIEDYGRFKQDSKSNNKIVFKYSNNAWKNVKCSILKPGDLIKVVKEEEVTADILIIQSSNDTGYCYIDTKNLDGETNLKEKCALEEFKNLNENDYSSIIGSVECDKPDENLTSWEGSVYFQKHQTYTDLKNLILKGCTLKNTEYVIGIVIYSGHNTKIMKNSKKPRQKVSKVMLVMNRLLYGLFILNIVVCIIFACLNVKFVKENSSKFKYIFLNDSNDGQTDSNFSSFIFSFLTFFIAYSQIIPISLYVVLELVKIFQGILIFYDADLYDIQMKKHAMSRTTDLIEELGQVEFIFSDKTGTLTCNSMVLKKCFVNNKVYGMIQTEKHDQKFTINGDTSAKEKILSENLDDLKDKIKLSEFFTLLALCHSVFPEKTDKGILYQGSSPDDIALVKGAQQLGVEFASKEFNDLLVTNHLTKETSIYTIRCDIPFSSDRKRMSVVVQEKTSKRLLLLTKGADNIMLGNQSNSKSIITDFSLDSEKENVTNILNLFSKEGLRILVMGQKYLDPIQYLDWEKRYKGIRNSGLSLAEISAEIECNLSYVGCSAIEDKLQDGVPDTIANFLKCGIRIWVLTGDKQDTAIEIAKSCKLMNERMHIIDLSTDPDSVQDRLKEVAHQLSIENLFDDQNQKINLERINSNLRGITDQDISIIIDGVTLEIILEEEEYARIFLLIALSASSVVCCRVSPKQKAKVVQLVRKYGDWVTLSIGDGSNDVPMLMEANIGVGIQGNEGTQAARSSDYSICQFKFLEKLLLVYGRDGYVKITKFICYYFYKNIVLVFTELYFAFFDGFSGQIFFADYLGTMFNAFFTSWPCLFTFILEREHNLATCKRFPILYQAGPQNYYFNFKTFWKYIFYALLHSTLSFFLPTLGMYFQVGPDGSTFNHWRISTICFCCIIQVVTLKLFVMSNNWNIINMLSFIFALAFFYVCLLVLSSETISISFQPELTGVTFEILKNQKALITILIVPILCVLPDIVVKQICYNLYPNPSELLKKFNDSIEIKHLMREDSIDSIKKLSIQSQLELNNENNILETHDARAMFNNIKPQCKEELTLNENNHFNTSQVSRLPLKVNIEDNLVLLKNKNHEEKKVRETKFEEIKEEEEKESKIKNNRRSSVLMLSKNIFNTMKKKDRSNSVFDKNGMIENILRAKLSLYNKNPNEISSNDELDFSPQIPQIRGQNFKNSLEN